MSDGQLGEAMVPIRATLDKLDSDLAGARSKIEGVLAGAWQNVQKVGKVALAGIAVGTVAAVTAVASLGVNSVNAFGQFQGQMNEVFTLLPGITEDAMSQMSGDVLQFSKDFAVLPEEVVPALYQSLSAGVPQDNVFSFLETAQMAAVGGVTELETAVDGITSVVNAYGADVLDAATASDVMFTAVRLGKTDFEQLSSSLFNVIPTAASLGVGFADVSAQLATLTAQGTPTSVATTQIRSALVEASKGGSKLSNALAELTGKSFTELIDQGFSSVSIFQMLRESMPEQEFKDLFGSVEALNAVLGTTGPNYEATMDAMDAMADSAGATAAAYDTMNTGIERSKERFQAFKEVALIQVGNALSPLIDMVTEFGTNALPVIEDVLNTAVIPAVQDIANLFKGFFLNLQSGQDPIVAIIDAFLNWTSAGENLSDSAYEMVLNIANLWENIKTGAQPIIDIITQFVSWQDVLTGLAIFLGGTLLVALAGVIGTIATFAAPIVAIIAIVALLRHAWENNWGGIQEKTQAVIDFISNLITSVMTFVRDFWAANGDEILAKANQIWQTISDFINTTITTIQTIIVTVATAIATFWQAHGEAILTTAQDIWTMISDFISGVWDTLTALFAAFKAAFEGDWYSFGENLRVAWDTAWETILNLLANIWNFVQPILSDLIQNVFDKFASTDWGSIGRGIIDGVKNAISSGAGKIADAARSAAQAALNAAKGFLGISSPSVVAAEEIGKPFTEGISLGVEEGISRARTAVTDAIGGIFGGAGGEVAKLLKHFGLQTAEQLATLIPTAAEFLSEAEIRMLTAAGFGPGGGLATEPGILDGRAGAVASEGDTFVFQFPTDMAKRQQDEIERMIDAALARRGIRADGRIRTG